MLLNPPVIKRRLSWGVVDEVPNIFKLIIIKRNGEETDYDNVSNVDNAVLCFDKLQCLAKIIKIIAIY